jgi:hypothetical protein
MAELAIALRWRLARVRLLFGQTVEQIHPALRDRFCHNRGEVIAQRPTDQLVK